MAQGLRRRRTLRELIWERPGSPFELFGEWRHPLLRAEFRRLRRPRRAQTAILAGTPLVALAAALMLMAVDRQLAAVAAMWFVSLWPLVLMFGAAMSTAGAVNEEIEQDTALQLVLTPLPARPLAAAKVLPRVVPFAAGAAAAVPVCVMACGGGNFLADGFVPTPLLVWPCRMLTPLFGATGREAMLLPACSAALVMCLTDVLLVWLAALVGISAAVRHRGRARTMLALPFSLAGIGLYSVMATALGYAVAAAISLPLAAVLDDRTSAAVIAAVLGLPAGAAGYVFAMWGLALVRCSREALGAMQAFDRLANEEYGFPLPS